MKKFLLKLIDVFTDKATRDYLFAVEYPDGLYGWVFRGRVISYRNASGNWARLSNQWRIDEGREDRWVYLAPTQTEEAVNSFNEELVS